MLKGIDVSSYQQFGDYEQLNESQLAFVYIKASEGNIKDRKYDEHSNGFAKTCLLKGAYHYFHFDIDAKQQAQTFINAVGQLGPLDLPPALDIEDTKFKTANPTDFASMISLWMDDVQAALGVRPMIYTGGWYWKSKSYMNDLKQFSNEKLWVSWYSDQNPPMFGGWQSASFWQYNGGAPLQWLADPKARIDLNYYTGDSTALWSLTKEKQIAPSVGVNDKVEAVQYVLKKNNFYAGNIDGQFGANTIAGLNAWQMKNGLAKQDVITPNQWAALFNLSPTVKEFKPVAIAKPGVVTVEKLNIRSNAGANNPMVAAPLLQGQTVSILEESNGWYKVKTEVTGWVSKNYIKTV